mgnify:CR=1 FL=1
MGVKIGNNNTIKNSNIAETVNGCSANGSDCKKKVLRESSCNMQFSNFFNCWYNCVILFLV